MKVILRPKESKSIAFSFSGEKRLEVKHNTLYDYLYDSEDNFYLIVDDILYPEVSTAFNFI
jgi:hypothetical protein